MRAGIALALLAASPAAGQSLCTVGGQDCTLLAVQAQIAAIANSSPQFVAAGAYITQAQLAAQYPAGAAYLGKLAHISDAWGSVSTTLVEEYDSTLGYYWRPQRTDYATNTVVAAGQTINLVPLQTPPIVVLSTASGGLTTGAVTINVPPTCPWPGAQFHIYSPPVISATAAVNISGLVGTGTLPMAQASDKVLTCTSSGWRSN